MATTDAGRVAGCCAAGAAGAQRARNLGRDASHGQHGRLAGGSANRRESRSGQDRTLTKIKLPPGFHISLYALVPDARHIAVGPQGVATFVGTRKSKVWVVTDRARGGVGDEVKEFAPTLPKKIPNGGCFSKDGFLYIAEQNRVLEYPAAEFFYESAGRCCRRRRSRRRADPEIRGEL